MAVLFFSFRSDCLGLEETGFTSVRLELAASAVLDGTHDSHGKLAKS
jgi:hypothetical protein